VKHRDLFPAIVSMDTIDPGFTPSQCPNPDCEHHHTPQRDDWFTHQGFHHTQAHGRVQRFRCADCRRTFSRQTFDIDYFSKKRIPWTDIASIAQNPISNRSFARDKSLSPTTVGRKIRRLAQWTLQSPECFAFEVPLGKDHAG